MVDERFDPAQPDSYQQISIHPLSIHIGAEISGIDLRNPMEAETLREVRQVFLHWKVVFFRGQNLNHAQHVAFARQMGEPTIGHVVFGHDDEFPEIYSIAKHRAANSIKDTIIKRPWTGWHTDITAAVNPPMASILRGVTVPPYGGDTFWTNLGAAYQGLSETMKAFVGDLDGLHKFEMPEDTTTNAAYTEKVGSRMMESIHPLVTVHPETGERILAVSPDFLCEIEGLEPRESQSILELLWEHAIRPEYTVRFKWQAGDIAMWDNRSTAHLAPSDIFESDFDRQLYRVTLVGERLAGVDGRQSRALAGDPILSAREELTAKR